MKVLIIGGNRFVGLRLSLLLDRDPAIELHILNRTGQAAHTKNAVLHKGDRRQLEGQYLDRDWDAVIDFATFSADEARASVEFFRDVGRYIFVSTASVYELAGAHREADFDPGSWVVRSAPTEAERANFYQFGKRQAEAVFHQHAPFPTLSVRFPFIVGPDDYTRRLDFHVERIRNRQPIFFPALPARISMVNSEDAASFLLWALPQTLRGALNVASPEPIALQELVALIEQTVGQQVLRADENREDIHSPYGVSHDGYLDVSELLRRGYRPKALTSWLAPLIRELAPPSTGGSSALH